MQLIRNIFLLSMIFSTNIAFAEIQTYIRSYTYQASETDSKVSARNAAVSQVEQLLLGELGTLIKSRIDISQNSLGKNLSQHEITSLTSGVVKTEILSEKWDGYQYIIKAKLKADPDKVAKKLMQMSTLMPHIQSLNAASTSDLLLQTPGKVIIVARHEVGEESEMDDDEVTKLLSEIAFKVVKKKLPAGSDISTLIDLDDTEGFIFEDYEARNSKASCQKNNADMIISVILDEIGDLRRGWKRDMLLAIYNCKMASMVHHRFHPTAINEGAFPREASVERELRKLIREYIDAI